MPKVGNKTFSYDAAGKKAAAKEAKKTGQPMQTAYKKSPVFYPSSK